MDSFGQLDFTGTYNPNGGAVSLSTKGALVRFFTREELVPFKSEAEGRPIYRSAEFVQVSFPGEHDEVYREATPADKKNWPRQYEAYKAGKLDIADGTPLLALFPANPEIVESLRSSKIHTVEQLADLSDTAVQNSPMGTTEWQAKAKRFLDVTRDAGRLGKIEQRQRDLDTQLEASNRDNDALRARIAELEASAEKRGRRAIPTDA